MILERIKSEGLAHNSYFVGSGNSAVVIDPRRDIQIYSDLALKQGMKIKFILETHRNEDYVIGSLELANETGAEIYHGPGLTWGYGKTLTDGQEFHLGRIALKAINTPGHTDESMSFILTDTSTGIAPVMVFTGDSLLINDTGRIDFYGQSELTRMATNLYESIFNKLLPLGDGVILNTAHGAGSICGLRIADRDESTLGIERLQNPFLQLSRDEFIKCKISEQHEKAPYFSQMEKYNQYGPPLLNHLPNPSLLPSVQFKKVMETGALVVDTSEPTAFGGAHIKGSYNIWLEGLPVFAGWVIPYNQPILLVLQEKAHLEKAMHYLYRVGFDNVTGVLKDGIEGWYNAGLPIEKLSLMSVFQLKEKLDRHEDLSILDVRDQEEWKDGHIQGSRNIYVGQVQNKLAEIPRDKPIAVLCSVGHRAGIAASVLLKEGYPDVFNILGGMSAWESAGFPLSNI